MGVKVVNESGGKILEIQASGKLSHSDYDQFVTEFENRLRAGGKLRVLFEMIDFHGWEARAVWDDIKFDAKHFSDIERIALVGEKKWEKGMSVFCKPFTTAKVRYFDRSERAEARKWLEES